MAFPNTDKGRRRWRPGRARRMPFFDSSEQRRHWRPEHTSTSTFSSMWWVATVFTPCTTHVADIDRLCSGSPAERCANGSHCRRTESKYKPENAAKQKNTEGPLLKESGLSFSTVPSDLRLYSRVIQVAFLLFDKICLFLIFDCQNLSIYSAKSDDHIRPNSSNFYPN